MRRIPRIVPIILFSLATPFLLGAGGGDDPHHLHYLVDAIEDLDERVSALEKCGCDGVLYPVCGENGRTYINRCEARCARVRISDVGLCPVPVCGGDTELSCDEGSFCELPPGCDEDEIGRCEEIPDVCTREWRPVCGCDGMTYANDCTRRQAGVAVEHRGECGESRVCGDNSDCREDWFCQKEPGVCDSRGECRPRPDACTKELRPVCGCDGETYPNPCVAAAKGASIEHRGPCDAKVYLCHVPGPNWHKRHTIRVSRSAVPAHLRNHGDHLGKCRYEDDDRDDDDRKKAMKHGATPGRDR